MGRPILSGGNRDNLVQNVAIVHAVANLLLSVCRT